MSIKSGVTVYYDRDCPLCSRFVAMQRLREASGSVRLVDIREGGDEVENLKRSGFDLDYGMVVDVGDKRYYADAAVHVLAAMSSRVTIFNKVNAWVFASPAVSRMIYPVLAFGRRRLLQILGRKLIQENHIAHL